MSKDNGGAAFPVECTFIDGEVRGKQTGNYTGWHQGMSLRDWYATHAPAEIPEWFKHAPANPRPTIPIPHLSLADAQYQEWEGLGDWLDKSDVSQEVREFDRKYEAAYEAANEWDRQSMVGRYFAWRWHYADAMIKAREA